MIICCIMSVYILLTSDATGCPNHVRVYAVSKVRNTPNAVHNDIMCIDLLFQTRDEDT
jgi:hypothetical protein